MVPGAVEGTVGCTVAGLRLAVYWSRETDRSDRGLSLVSLGTLGSPAIKDWSARTSLCRPRGTLGRHG